MGQIAAQAGVSRATVSYVLNGRLREDGSIGESTRLRILEAAAELGYHRNELARSVVTGKSHMLGMLGGFPDLEQVGYMLAGAMTAAEEQGYSVKAMGRRGNNTEEEHVVRCLELRLAGIVALHMRPDVLAYLRTETERFGIPVVVLDSVQTSDWSVPVISDNMLGMRQAVEHLAGLGHLKIGMIAAGRPPGNSAPTLREECFVAAMAAQGLEVRPEAIASAGSFWIADEIEVAATQLLSRDGWRPSAIVCASDSLALVTMRVARRLGLRVPEDLSVVGYDDLLMASLSDPPLTTVAQDFMVLGRTAVESLLDMVEQREPGPGVQLVEKLVPTRLVVRETTGPVKSLTGSRRVS